MKKFIVKKPQESFKTFYDIASAPKFDDKKEQTVKQSKEINNVIKKDKEMTTKDKIQMVASVMDEQPRVKRMKKDKGLIERTESSITVLTEDNKELLKD